MFLGHPFGTDMCSCVLLSFAWIAACAGAYFVEPNDKYDLANWSLFLANLSLFLIFGLALFHPQWILLGHAFLGA